MNPTNFAFLSRTSDQLVRLGRLAEHYYVDDPNTCLIKLRQYAELLALQTAAQMGLLNVPGETQYDLLRRLQDQGVLPRQVGQLFGEIRRAGNEATHNLVADYQLAGNTLKMAWQLGVWYYRTFYDPKFTPVEFIPAEQIQEQAGAVLELASEVESSANVEVQKIAAQQRNAEQKPASAFQAFLAASSSAAEHLHLDEAETRQLIDQQLRQAGWQADSLNFRFSKGTRPERGKNMAIAEWPTTNGPADYVLFVGLTPIACVEAKRKNIDVSAALQQAKRYSRGFSVNNEFNSPSGPWGEYNLPFAFSSNGRPYLRQLETRSGIWFCDLRRPENLAHALDGWYTPEGLVSLLKRDEDCAHQLLDQEPFDYGFSLRSYQKKAIRAVELAIAEGKREVLIAMATGTGKTKTCIALIYRLLKVKRFRRVLFLVDRSALGEQAVNAFKDTRMDHVQSFADIFGIKELKEQNPDGDTAVQIATVQGMVKRILYTNEGQLPPPVDQYDCIIVDECHRGYLLDRELSDTEITFRSFEDYISKYRRVLDYFDAVKIGLTATPALHTTEIFGLPAYTYSYREAVIDGYLIDHEPPVQITTELSKSGIVWKPGETVKVYNPSQSQVELYQTPDEIRLDVEDFNRKVITESFNRVVCQYLARELDPGSRQKTLIFCVKDEHADLVVKLLKEAFNDMYGSIDDDAVIKITGNADQPLQLIRRFKNERNPNVAVTVDLLTTGVDVPEICNLVFLRRVNSRILFDQMLGRATRLCDEIGKETFRVLDAVRLYEALQELTAMQPVVVNPKLSFTQLAGELATVSGDAQREVIREQLVAKLQRKKRTLNAAQRYDFEAAAGMPPEAFINRLLEMPLQDVAEWFTRNPLLSEILDRQSDEVSSPVLISEHSDRLSSVEHGYGRATKPEDYLKEFSEFIQANQDTIPALVTVLTRPRDLTRKQLRELAIELDRAGFSEVNLATAWRESTNQEIAAQIVGFIRHIATGDPLVPYEQRVDWALQQMLASRSWSTPQRQWLQRIAAQTKANRVVDREALDDPDLIFRRDGGGFTRLNRIFDNELETTLDTFHDLIWSSQAS